MLHIRGRNDKTTSDRPYPRMTETLEDEYPEGWKYIQQAVDEHGEAWVLEHYYEQLYPLDRLMDMPEKDELPFYDPDKHDTMTQKEQTEMYQMWAAYRENLRTGSKPDNSAPHDCSRR